MVLLRVIMIGDVVGDSGLEALEAKLPGLVRECKTDFVVVNGENADNGFGMTAVTLKRILAAGADVVSSGNHVWEKREFQPLLEEEQRIVRPANYPPGVPGRGWVKIEKAQGQDPGIPVSWIVINLQGRDFMPAIDCPFRTFDAITGSQTDIAAPAHGPSDPEGEAPGSLKKPKAILLVDFHAESTREKESLAFYLDGRASMVVGTHTHVQTADERILPQGTAYITDLGMTGAEDGIIGMDAQICLNRTRTQVAYRMECAKGTALVRGVIAEIDRETGKAVSIKRISR